MKGRVCYATPSAVLGDLGKASLELVPMLPNSLQLVAERSLKLHRRPRGANDTLEHGGHCGHGGHHGTAGWECRR